jgi:hypothetical protein
MDPVTLLSEVDEMIAQIESLNAQQARGRRGGVIGSNSEMAAQVLKARQARLWWLRRVRAGLKAKRRKGAPLH